MPSSTPEDENLVKDVFFNMNDEKKYTDEEGVEWKRVFLVLSCPVKQA